MLVGQGGLSHALGFVGPDRLGARTDSIPTEQEGWGSTWRVKGRLFSMWET